MININLLPKNLRRVREPGYWRLLAIVFPLLVFGVLTILQVFALQTVRNRIQDRDASQQQLDLLQPVLQEQADLRRRQQQLNELIGIAQAVRENRIVWSAEINTLLETLPAQGGGGNPNIDFRTLNMRAVDPPQAREERFEGQTVIAEMAVSGQVIDTEVLATFIRALETSSSFGVLFQNASRDQTTGIYQYNLTVGAFDGGIDEPR